MQYCLPFSGCQAHMSFASFFKSRSHIEHQANPQSGQCSYRDPLSLIISSQMVAFEKTSKTLPKPPLTWLLSSRRIGKRMSSSECRTNTHPRACMSGERGREVGAGGLEIVHKLSHWRGLPELGRCGCGEPRLAVGLKT